MGDSDGATARIRISIGFCDTWATDALNLKHPTVQRFSPSGDPRYMANIFERREGRSYIFHSILSAVSCPSCIVQEISCVNAACCIDSCRALSHLPAPLHAIDRLRQRTLDRSACASADDDLTPNDLSLLHHYTCSAVQTEKARTRLLPDIEVLWYLCCID